MNSLLKHLLRCSRLFPTDTLRHIFYTVSFVLLFTTGEVKAGITEKTVLDSLDLSEFNTVQKTIITEELKIYTESLDPLAVSNLEEWKKKVKELLVKIRDGFRIYKLARSPEITERIDEFNSHHSTVKVYVFAYVEGAFLNNIFQRLSETYYQSIDPDGFVKLKYKFKQAPKYTENTPIFLPTPEIETSASVKKKIGDALYLSLTTEAKLPDANGYELNFSDASTSKLNTDISIGVRNVLLKLAGVESLEAVLAVPQTDLLEVPIVNKELITYISPAGTPVQIPSDAEIFDLRYGDDLFPKGALLSFRIGSINYKAKINSNPINKNGESYFPFMGYFETQTGWGSKCYEQTSISSGSTKVRWIERYYDNSQKKCGLIIKEGNCNFSKDRSIKLLCTEQYKSLEPNALSTDFKETSTIHKGPFKDGCYDDQASDPLQEYITSNKIQAWMSQKGINGSVWVGDCVDGKVYSANGSKTELTKLTTANAENNIKTKNYNGDFGVFACYDKNSKKWTVTHSFKTGILNPPSKYKGELANLEAKSNEYVQKEIDKRNNGNGLETTLTTPLGEGEQFKYEGMGMIEAVLALKDFTKLIVNNAKVPEKFWNNTLPEYKTSVVNIPSLMSGAGDQGLEEVTGLVQLLDFGLEVATNPEVADQVWTSIKNVKIDDLKKIAISMSGYENYAKGGCHAKYQGGRHAVVIAMGVLAITKKLSSIKEVADNADNGIAKGLGIEGNSVDVFYTSARQNALVKFGKEAEDLIYFKFRGNGGAAAEIINHFGQDGVTALKKVNNIQDAANELLKGKTAYRYIDSRAPYLNSLKSSGKIPENPNKTYFSTDKFDNSTEAMNKAQLPDNDANWRLEFDANQVVGKTEFPYGKHQNADYLEPITRSYPNLPGEKQGVGGATQFLTDAPIKLKSMINLKTGEIINF